MSAALVLFGPMGVRWDARPVTFATSATRALLSYLAVESDRPHPREHLAALLWPDQRQTAAYANVRQTLFRMRKAFPDPAAQDLVQISQHTLQFNRAVAQVDVLRFEGLLAETRTHPHGDLLACPVCIERLEQAVALYRGEFLQGLFLEQSEAFGDWLRFKREELHRQALLGLHTLACAYEARADYDQMQAYAVRQLALEPWREEAHAQSMRALAARGDRTAALAQYEACCRILHDELGAPPSEEIQALDKRIRAGDLILLARPTAPSSKPFNNLPLQRNPLIGREQDVAALRTMLSGADARNARIVTLTGPGGTGKTRLALQVAAALGDHFGDGVCFVDLAPISDTALVIPTIAMALDLKEVAGETLIDTLKRTLQDREMLLLLDNVEQVSRAAPQVSQLICTAPGVKLLVTSRMALRITGEKEYPVPPLSLPDPENLSPLAQITRSEAVRLFIERATDIKPDFHVTDDNRIAVAEICVRLDGLPLAIELAAARIRLLPPQALLARLNTQRLSGCPGRLTLLTGGPQDVAVRQQTLRGAIDWSYDLLNSREQQLFRRLAVFEGGCSLAAVEAVCSLDSGLTVDVLDHLGALVHSNLLRQEEGVGGQPRFRMLETIHEFAREKLAEHAETDELRRHHAIFFVELTEDAELDLRGPNAAERLARLHIEYDNLRAALAWARQGMDQGLAERINIGLRLAAVLWRFWYVRGYWSEGSAWLATLVSNPGSHHLDYPDQINQGARATALRGAGALAIEQGDYVSGRRFFEQSVHAYNEVGDTYSSAVALGRLGDIAYAEGDYASARFLLEEVLAQVRRLDDKPRIAGFLTNLGEVMRAQGDYGAARRCNEEALAILTEADVELRDADWTLEAVIRSNLGKAVQREGDCDRAAALLTQALTIAERAGHIEEAALCILGLAEVAARRGAAERSARLLGTGENLLDTLGAKLWPADRLDLEHARAVAHAQLDEDTFDRARSEGRMWSLGQAIDYALDRPTAR